VCFSFELALQNYVTIKIIHREAPPVKTAMEDPSQELETKSRGQEQKCNILGSEYDCCMGGDHTHTDKEMIRKCPYQDVNTTHILSSPLVFIVVVAENNYLFFL
jgi:hypothetical protein